MSFINYNFDTPDQALDATKLYQGIVVDNNDPKQLGRVRVRVEQLMPTEAIPNEHCPWALMKRPLGWGGNSDKSFFAIPEKDSKILVQFVGGCVYSPIYETLPVDGASKLAEVSTNYPKRYGFFDPDTSKFIVDYKDHTLDYVHQSDYQFHIKTDKSVNVNCPYDETEVIARDQRNNIGRDLVIEVGQDLKITVTRNVTEDVQGTYTVTVLGDAKIYGSTVTVAPISPASGSIKLGADSPMDFIALKAAIDKIKAAFDAHVHTGVQGGISNSGQPSTPLTPYVSGTDFTIQCKAS
jgi:hypothetical protein